ncbi:MAG: hypothetical protein F6K50_31595 [Moorea sp. SIO3I7]|uniref:hypothetical protein n=1 Tax=unclassified Moorena TaxID=2683338 RepID=UPI0013CDB347|nr:MULTISPECIES: hypothetical protein [unclassified Moorena]NEN99856.1 hypothetical protein [Moorena sp. SIO3I7]NEO60280.1 hypothetical protein [Moorena sp. SIO4G2]NEO17601.1 hypothetical protein [Moorena sp. SIO3E8]NEO24735.1 hypothetical protein [Moorena sp. SIO4A5]NEQ04170.1 hypothetical protein [Moorena sp. SIO3F7]
MRFGYPVYRPDTRDSISAYPVTHIEDTNLRLPSLHRVLFEIRLNISRYPVLGAYIPIIGLIRDIHVYGAFEQRFVSLNPLILSLFGYHLSDGSVQTYFLSSCET